LLPVKDGETKQVFGVDLSKCIWTLWPALYA